MTAGSETSTSSTTAGSRSGSRCSGYRQSEPVPVVDDRRQRTEQIVGGLGAFAGEQLTQGGDDLRHRRDQVGRTGATGDDDGGPGVLLDGAANLAYPTTSI
ncbi:hypothetical protein ACTI_66490 [Actinoplanes sp. OR16]|uniref:hypothetical protein n=1 Tax=Actinoplanes sp. OR16 TaxID=946334 RepID=UPI000F6E2046|nr:hypothetical protein [Actinoplanes sp. OR16]BBH69964.1 hypothetical protein ACTI_66490 [Actinoplanes sp. OR16]